jgi:Histidine kinase
MSPEPLQSAQPRAIPLASQLTDEANHRIANHLAMLAALIRLQAKGVDQAHIALSGKDVQRQACSASERPHKKPRELRVLARGRSARLGWGGTNLSASER